MSSSAVSPVGRSEVTTRNSGWGAQQVCEVPVFCQPLAASQDRDFRWPAMLVGASLQEVGLVLGRRFERGVNLAIEVPEGANQPADTLLARVLQVEPLPDGRWRHGCQLVSELDADGLAALLGRSPQDLKELREQVLRDVTLEWSPAAPGTPAFRARRVRLQGRWPLPPGTIIYVSPGAQPQLRLRLRVQACVQSREGWRLCCAVLGRPTADALAAFGLADLEGTAAAPESG